MQVTGRFYKDIIEEAVMLEQALEGFLPEYELGLYLPGIATPAVILNDKITVLSKKVDKVISVFNYTPEVDIKAISGRLYNETQKRLIPDVIRNQLTPFPTFPVHGVAIIEAVVKNMLLQHSCWGKGQKVDHFDIIESFLPEEVHGSDLIQRAGDFLIDLRQVVNEFLGKDKWIMFFHSIEHGELKIERTIDYRIYSWTLEHGNEFGSTVE